MIRRFCIVALWSVASASVSPSVADAAGQGLAQVGDVIAAERAFASLSTEKGIKPAFLAHLAADAIVFRPGPVPAQDWYRNHPAAAGTLEWAPDLAAIAVTGDMGYTSGPWAFTNGEQAAHGHFVTVWRHERDGTWKAVLDAGASHAPVDLEVEPVIPTWCEPRVVDEARVHDEHRKPIGSRDQLLAADRDLGARIVARGWAEAMAASAAEDLRLCRPGQLPVDGKPGVLKALAAAPRPVACAPVAAGVSRGDLGYTYGRLEVPSAGADAAADSAAGFAYVRIWRLDATGKRVVVVDATSAMGQVARHAATHH